MPLRTESAYLAGGCFWCLEAVFRKVRGVTDVVSGYAGGQAAEPTYEQVSSGNTGHAETVRVEYDPAVISYDDILSIFFYIHDPTSLNRQGHDVGTQYRSAIFYADDGQRRAAQARLDELAASGKLAGPVVTELAKLERFYPAEDYHQRYFEKNPDAAYCQAVIAPKLEKSRAAFRKFFSG